MRVGREDREEQKEGDKWVAVTRICNKGGYRLWAGELGEEGEGVRRGGEEGA